jgi:hypothetical protein
VTTLRLNDNKTPNEIDVFRFVPDGAPRRVAPSVL